MAWFGRRRPAPQGDYLDLVPCRLVESEAGDDGKVVLLVPRYRDAVWGRLLQPRLGPAKRFVKVPLETRGAALWQAVDGRRTVRELVAIVGEAAPGDGQDLARRTCLYVQALVDNGFLVLAEAAPPADGKASERI